jgi:hypothetical protein
MLNGSGKFSARIRWLERLFNLDERSFKYLFCFISLLTIPVFAYLYTLPLSLILWFTANLFGLSEKSIDIVTKLGVALCFIFAFGTQYQLWKIYKN